MFFLSNIAVPHCRRKKLSNVLNVVRSFNMVTTMKAETQPIRISKQAMDRVRLMSAETGMPRQVIVERAILEFLAYCSKRRAVPFLKRFEIVPTSG
jgi:hypothetical protein